MKKIIYVNMLFVSGLGIIAALLPAIIFYGTGNRGSITPPFFMIVIPAIAVAAALTYFVSKRLTKRITSPINKIDPSETDKYPYDELSPFLRAISKQNERINSQLETLEERTNTIQTIIADMREGLILLDKDGVILSANDSAMGFFSAEVQEYLNRNIIELTRRRDFLSNIRAALNGEAGDVTIELALKTVQIYFDPIWHYGGVNGAILLFLDITEKANSEKLRREFTANVSHELKTPLTVISGLSEMIALGMAKDADTAEFAGKIKTEAERMIALVNDILKLSELDENPESKQFEPFNMRELADSAAFSLSRFSMEKNVNINISGGDFEVNANKSMIAELLFNLIDNAIKYNVENGRVEVELSMDKTDVKIEVSDTGIGISEEHLPRIFERFYRADKSRSKKTGGTGLGLSIVKHIAQYHNGAASIESVPGKGTKVVVVLRPQNLTR